MAGFGWTCEIKGLLPNWRATMSLHRLTRLALDGMAPTHDAGYPTVTANNSIADLLSAPLGPDWTVDRLAEQLLGAIAARPSEEPQEFVLDADTLTSRQSSRLLRPLLACLATKSAAEAGTPTNLYGGHLSFQRPGPKGPVWILGQFENSAGSVRMTVRRSSSPPDVPAITPGQPAAIADTASPGPFGDKVEN